MSRNDRLDHTCIVCGQAYHSCDNCERIKSFTPWRSLCDTFNHYSVYLAIKSFEAGFSTKEEAITELKRLGVTKTSYANWTDGAKARLDEIFASPKMKITKKIHNETEAQESVVED